MAVPNVEEGDGSATVVPFPASHISVHAKDRYSPTDDAAGRTGRSLIAVKLASFGGIVPSHGANISGNILSEAMRRRCIQTTSENV